MRFIAKVSTRKVGSECETAFEIDDAELEGLDEYDRDARIQKEAMDVVFEMELVQVWTEEGDE